jgi:hypothetical protein
MQLSSLTYVWSVAADLNRQLVKQFNESKRKIPGCHPAQDA